MIPRQPSSTFRSCSSSWRGGSPRAWLGRGRQSGGSRASDGRWETAPDTPTPARLACSIRRLQEQEPAGREQHESVLPRTIERVEHRLLWLERVDVSLAATIVRFHDEPDGFAVALTRQRRKAGALQ